MKSFRFILVLLVAAWVSGGTLDAQTDGADALRFPGIHTLSSRNLDEFFVQLERWSQDVKDKAEPNRYNDVLVEFFKAEWEDIDRLRGEYAVLPVVKVLEYDFDLNPASWTDCYLDEWPALDSIPVRISYYIPVVECEKKVLYLTPEVKGIILSFLNERIGQSRERYMMSAKYMPVFMWPDGPGGYSLSSWPLDDTVYVGKDGFVFLCESLGGGALYFVPWGKDPIEIREWMI
jgi:hypothetical protein